MQTLKKLFWYAGVEPEEYQQCQQEVAEDNRKKLQLYLMIAAGFLFFCFCVSGGVKVLRPYSMCYGVGFLVIAGLEAVNLMFPEHNGLLLTWLMYALAGALYVMGMVMSFITPQWPSVEFVAFLLATPLLFTMAPVQHIANIVFFGGIFIAFACRFEAGDTLVADLFAVVIFGALSCVISTLMMFSS